MELIKQNFFWKLFAQYQQMEKDQTHTPSSSIQKLGSSLNSKPNNRSIPSKAKPAKKEFRKIKGILN